MSDQVALLLAAGLVAGVLLAIVLNRKLKVWWGKKGVQVGDEGSTSDVQNDQEMVVTDHGVIEDAEQALKGGTHGRQKMEATGGGKLKGVKQHIGTEGGKR